MSGDAILVAAVCATAFELVAVVLAVVMGWRIGKARIARAKAMEATLQRAFNAYPLALVADSLVDHRYLPLLEKAPDDLLQWAALGGAMLAAHKASPEVQPALEALNDLKFTYLVGEMGADEYQAEFALRLEALTYPTGDLRQPRPFTFLERTVICGCAMDGAKGFALMLKHYTEGDPRRDIRAEEVAAEEAGQANGNGADAGVEPESSPAVH